MCVLLARSTLGRFEMLRLCGALLWRRSSTLKRRGCLRAPTVSGRSRWRCGKSEDVNARIGELCPDRVDVFFDNVGGGILEAALHHIAERARLVLCGGISGYNATEPVPGPSNLMNLITRRGRMEGFIVLDYMDRRAEAETT